MNADALHTLVLIVTIAADQTTGLGGGRVFIPMAMVTGAVELVADGAQIRQKGVVVGHQDRGSWIGNWESRIGFNRP